MANVSEEIIYHAINLLNTIDEYVHHSDLTPGVLLTNIFVTSYAF